MSNVEIFRRIIVGILVGGNIFSILLKPIFEKPQTVKSKLRKMDESGGRAHFKFTIL